MVNVWHYDEFDNSWLNTQFIGKYQEPYSNDQLVQTSMRIETSYPTADSEAEGDDPIIKRIVMYTTAGSVVYSNDATPQAYLHLTQKDNDVILPMDSEPIELMKCIIHNL